MSAIRFEASLDTKKLDKGIQDSNKSVKQWSDGVQSEASKIDASLSKVGGAIAAYFSIQVMSRFGMEVVNVRGEFQKLGIAFETMLGSKDEADRLMAQAIRFAALTPFTLTDVASNIKQLMAMGIATEDVMETMKNLGDVAAGVSVPIGRVALNYGQVAVMGKLQGRELRDFAIAGIPLADELAKLLGKQKDEIAELVSAGKIGFPMVQAAFKAMASEGGRFYNLMEKQNASVTGQVSNLTDKWEVMLNAIGESNEGLIYAGIEGLASLVENYETVIDVLTGLVTVYGAYRLAIMVVAREQKIQVAVNLLVAESNGFLVASEARAIVMKQRSLVAQQKLNASMLANPYVIAATAAAALGFVIYKLVTHQTDLEKAMKKANLEIENEKDRVTDLFATLKFYTQGTEDFGKAKDAVLKAYNEYIPAQLKELKNLEDINEAQLLVNEALRENILIKVRGETLETLRSDYNLKILEERDRIIDKIKKDQGTEAGVTARLEIDTFIARYKEGLITVEELNTARLKLMESVGTVSKEGRATSAAAANMYLWFNKLTGSLDELKEETNAVNSAFNIFQDTLDAEKPPEVDPLLITATQQRLELAKELLVEEKKLADLEKKPGIDPLKAIAEQQDIVDALKKRLGIAKTKKEADDLDEQIKKQTGLLEDAIVKGNMIEASAIANKIVQLERELAVRERIMEQLINASTYERGFVPTVAPTGLEAGAGLTQFAAPAPKKKPKTLQEIQTEMNALRKINKKVIDDNARDQAEVNREQEEAIQRQLDLRTQLTASVAGLVYQLGEAAGMSREEQQALGGVLDSFTQLVSGDYIGAAFSLISGLLTLVPTEAQKFAAQIAAINRLMKEQQRLIDQSTRTGGQEEAIQGQIDLAEQQRAVYEEELRVLEIRLKDRRMSFFGLGGLFTQGLRDDIQVTLDSIAELDNEMEDLELRKQDLFAGGITQNTIASVIAEGFREGKTSVDDFADYMNNVLVDAVLDVFKAKILGPALDKATEYISGALSDNVLTDEEKAEINRIVAEAAATNKDLWEGLTGGLDMGGGMPSGLIGGITRTITEETGSELTGLARRIADDVRVNRDYNKLGISHLVNIEANTYNTVEELKLAVVELKGISMNTKPVFSGVL